jgi:hypothetical protein
MVSTASAAIFLQYGTLFGREPGVALLSVMIALKLLELKSRRDATVLVFLAYFLVITNFLYSQTLPTALLMLVAVLLVTATMIGLHQRQPAFRQTMSLAAQLLVQAIPLMVVLFVFFPRLPGPLWGLPRDTGQAVTGLSDSMSPGSFSQLSASADVAFRVEFPGPVPRTADLYWRGPVFWQFDGRIWSPGNAPPGQPAAPVVRALSEPISYAVTLEPHFERWLLRQPRYFAKLEAVIREARRPGLAVEIAAQNVGIRRSRPAQVLRHQPAVGMEHLAIAEPDLGAGSRSHLELHHAREVLPQVEHEHARLLLADRFAARSSVTRIGWAA